MGIGLNVDLAAFIDRHTLLFAVSLLGAAVVSGIKLGGTFEAEAFRKQLQQNLAKALEDILHDRVGLTEGCREVVGIGHTLGLETPLFDPFRGFESETDAFPVGEVRQHWAAKSLEEMDRQRTLTEAHYRDWILEAARKLQDHLQEQHS